jgi:hypothetical protein
VPVAFTEEHALPCPLPQDTVCNMAMVAQLAPALAKAGLPEEMQVQVRGRDAVDPVLLEPI